MWKFLKTLKIELPYDLAIPHLGIYLEKIIQRNTCTPVSTAALTTVKTQKEPQCPSIDEWIKKDVVLYTVECHPAINKNKIMPFAATWMDLKIIIPREVNQKDRQIP